jgi:hypothetical protein
MQCTTNIVRMLGKLHENTRQWPVQAGIFNGRLMGDKNSFDGMELKSR